MNKNKRSQIFGINIDLYTLGETLSLIDTCIKQKKKLCHTVVNANKIVLMQTDAMLKESVNTADVINVDGQAVVWAARLLGVSVPERVAGIDLMEALVEQSHVNKQKVFLLGAKEEVVSKLADIYSKRYSDKLIAGFRNGYFKEAEEPEVIKMINSSGAQMLFVAISSPRKENFLNKYKGKLNINFVMGVGGSFDVIAGHVRRAPVLLQNLGLEWFFRLMQEPRRMAGRYLYSNAAFLVLLARGCLKRCFDREKATNE
jgi:N-acetylglucosaminyldiphosphoundecaprenol N-acetyl-beta-D-mannosaminyltransferase